MMNLLEGIFDRLGMSLNACGLVIDECEQTCHGPELTVVSPVDGQQLAKLATAQAEDLNKAVCAAQAAFFEWRQTPAPVRGELVRRFGQMLRVHKQDLAMLVTLECGKILQESLG